MTGPTCFTSLRETSPSLDWPRLLMRFADHWRVLLSHLILFGFVYPDKRQIVPTWVMEELIRRMTASRPNSNNDVCYGTLLSREQYLHDLERLKYRDSRAEPAGADDGARDRHLDRRDCWNKIVLISLGERASTTGITSRRDLSFALDGYICDHAYQRDASGVSE